MRRVARVLACGSRQPCPSTNRMGQLSKRTGTYSNPASPERISISAFAQTSVQFCLLSQGLEGMLWDNADKEGPQ